MEQLCTACLCTGRKLYYIVQTGFYDLYSQILNEISVYNTSQMCVRVCWECRATLQRWQRFKDLVKRSHTSLLHIQDNNLETVSQASQLQIQHITTTSFPSIKVKTEVTDHLNVQTIDVNEEDPVVDTNGYFHAESIDVKVESEHCEPETFVNDLHVVFEDVGKETDLKLKSKRKLKEKSINKKIKTKKKKKLKVETKKNANIEETELNSDGISDREDFIHDNNDLEESTDLVEEKVEEFKCKECDLLFNLETEWRSHIDTVHKQTDRINKSKVKVKRKGSEKEKKPSKEVSRDEKPQCVECGKMFSSRKTYRYHLNVLHKGQNRYPCPQCGKVYQWKSNLGRHMRSHKARESGELYCATCDKRFASVATHRQHLRVSRRHVAEAEFSFVCDDCGKKFVNKTRLRDHIDWDHLHKVKFRCQLCNKPFKCHTSLYVHVQNVHRERGRDNLCHVCGKAYQNAAKLKYHIVAMHTSETPYECPQCGAAFGWYSSLYRHLREVHYKMKAQPKKSKRIKRDDILPVPNLQALQPGPASPTRSRL
ncbi:zinc finger protein 184-like [Achroia grisella]|uniref:zinc finger protein 184-like n=1 Tax=Achroia grisella TaxID=688607 RepID=UPI0027D2815F|nr:zinc finger protein 184-like [Achroia grisella]